MVIAAVNVLWAAAFIGYVRRSTTLVVRGGELLRPGDSNRVESLVVRTNPVATNATNAALAASPATNVSVPAAQSARLPVLPAGRQFGWQDVTNDLYRQYASSLRAVGCPDKQVRNVIVADVNELFDQRRLEQAVKSDSQWWRAETFTGTIPVQMFMAPANFDQERRELLDKLLGPGWEDGTGVKLPSLNPPGGVNLAGPVLGALPAETYGNVQEICARSMDRHQSFQMAKINNNEGVQMDSTDMAKLRDHTRTDLARILKPDQMEEFLLRYSHNSSKLRQEMRGLDLTPDEFRKVFRAIDPIEHQLQLDYGSPQALSQKQREQFESQRSRAIQEALAPQRYQQYMATKDPSYQQALATASQYGMGARAVKPLYDIQKSINTRRTQVSQDANLTPEQKSQALQSLAIEQQLAVQKMAGDPAYRQ